MINVSDITTEEKLAEILAQCGFASEPLPISASLSDQYIRDHLALARHLTGENYKILYVAIEGDVLQIYSWIMLVCKLQGEVSEEHLVEKIALCASPDRPPGDPSQCICLEMPLPFYHYEKVKFIGVDKTNGRFGEVTLKYCLHCRRYWLHYFVEYEVYRASGRYYMGLITPETAETITPETAVDYLGNLDWHLYGGSFFGGAGKSTSKGIYVD